MLPWPFLGGARQLGTWNAVDERRWSEPFRTFQNLVTMAIRSDAIDGLIYCLAFLVDVDLERITPKRTKKANT